MKSIKMIDKKSGVPKEDKEQILKDIACLETKEEKYIYIFNWLVENFSYAGYPVRTLHTEINDVDLLRPCSDEFKRVLWERQKPSKLGYFAHQQLKYWVNATEEQFQILKEKCANEHDERLFNFLKNKTYAEDLKLDEEELNMRFEFLDKQPTKYIGVCGDFAYEFEKICLEAGLKAVSVGGDIFNGYEMVGHKFNAVEINNEIKFLDISYAIHIKEEKQGLKPGHYNAEESDYCLASFDELKEYDGNDKRRLSYYCPIEKIKRDLGISEFDNLVKEEDKAKQ